MKKAFRNIVLGICAVLPSLLFAADGEWSAETSKDFFNPSLFEDAANWKNGVVPSGTADTAWMTNTLVNTTGTHYVKIPNEWALKTVEFKQKGVNNFLIGDRRLRLRYLRSPAHSNSKSSIVRLYVDQMDSENHSMGFYAAEVAGRVLSCATLNQQTTFAAYAGNFRADLAAWSNDPLVENPAPTNEWFVGAGSPAIYARRRTGELTGVWKQTAGSPYLTWVSGTKGLSLAPGAALTGVGGGIPEGTYLRRIFSDKIIEMSQPATETVENQSVTFAAFPAETRQTIAWYYKGDGGGSFNLNKHTAQDVLRVDILKLETQRAVTDAKIKDENIILGVNGGYVPGTLVLHDTAKFRSWLNVVNGHVEFQPMNAQGQAGIARLAIRAPSYKARLSVPATDTVASIQDLIVWGQLTKDGAGTLSVNVHSNVCHTMTIQEGPFVLTAENDLLVTNLTIAAGATFAKRGAGRLTIQKALTLSEGAVLRPMLGEDGFLRPIEVVGQTKLAGGTIDLSDVDATRLAQGVHTLISAGTNFTSTGAWSVVQPGGSFRLRVFEEDHALKLRVSLAGMTIYIR